MLNAFKHHLLVLGALLLLSTGCASQPTNKPLPAAGGKQRHQYDHRRFAG